MSYLGIMPVDWEERLDTMRMNRERLQRAKDALEASDVDVCFGGRIAVSKVHVMASVWPIG